MARPAVRDERRAQILDALYAVVAERGTLGASISEIAEQAGVARGALHYFFASKDEITASLMRRLGEAYVEHLGAYLDRKIAAASPSIVADAARYHFAGDADDAMRRIGVWIDYWGQAASQPAIRDVVLDVQRAARGLLARALLADRPDLRGLPDAALDVHAATLLALIEGGLLQWRFAAASRAPLERRSLAAAIAQAAESVARTIPTTGAGIDSSAHRYPEMSGADARGGGA